MLTNALREHLEDIVGSGIAHVRPLSGGDINEAFAFEAGGETYFIKIQNKPVGTNMFGAEQSGLIAIRGTGTVLTPQVFATGRAEGQSYLLMEYVAFRPATDDDWIKLGRNLARLHKTESSSFGLDHDNFIGTLPQINVPMTKWTEFYAQCRIQPQIDMAVSLLSPVDLKNWEHLCVQLESILTDEPPSLIHGDLWSGNVQMSDRGPVIYDPAISYANREMDLAMSMLFGGFSHLFYESYKAEFPVAKSGFDDRMQIYQLYYLLVHVNLFGVSYVPSVRGILKRYA